MDVYFKNKEVSSCRSCPLMLNSMDGMYCDHPFFEGIDVYDRHIISQSDLSGFPAQCPLRHSDVELITKINLNKLMGTI
jgi:hypothetical protein